MPPPRQKFRASAGRPGHAARRHPFASRACSDRRRRHPDPASLEAARSGAVVSLRWTLPDPAGSYRAIEIMRNTVGTAPGRGRVAGVRGDLRSCNDAVPDTTVTTGIGSRSPASTE